MVQNKSDILKPNEREFKKFVREQEEKYWFNNKVLYEGCIKEAKNLNLDSEKLEDVLRTFLINWGMMGRALNQKGKFNGLLEKLKEKDIKEKIEYFREKDLESIDLEKEKEKDKILKLYKALKRDFGAVTISKTLHLLCPDFFPIWDRQIIEKISGIGTTPTGYWKFMKEIKEFLSENEDFISKHSKKCNISKLRIIDEYLWWVSNEKEV